MQVKLHRMENLGPEQLGKGWRGIEVMSLRLVTRTLWIEYEWNQSGYDGSVYETYRLLSGELARRRRYARKDIGIRDISLQIVQALLRVERHEISSLNDYDIVSWLDYIQNTKTRMVFHLTKSSPAGLAGDEVRFWFN